MEGGSRGDSELLQGVSQENVEVVRRVIDVMDAEGFEAALPE
jgi:hypothetical protein